MISLSLAALAVLVALFAGIVAGAFWALEPDVQRLRGELADERRIRAELEVRLQEYRREEAAARAEKIEAGLRLVPPRR